MMMSMNKAKQLCTDSWRKQPIQTDMNDNEHGQGKTTVYWKLKETTYPDRHEMGNDNECEEGNIDPQWQTCTKIGYLIVHAQSTVKVELTGNIIAKSLVKVWFTIMTHATLCLRSDLKKKKKKWEGINQKGRWTLYNLTQDGGCWGTGTGQYCPWQNQHQKKHKTSWTYIKLSTEKNKKKKKAHSKWTKMPIERTDNWVKRLSSVWLTSGLLENRAAPTRTGQRMPSLHTERTLMKRKSPQDIVSTLVLIRNKPVKC